MPIFAYLLVAAVVGFILLSPKTAWGYVKGVRVQVRLAPLDATGLSLYMQEDAAAAYNAMRASAAGDGVTLTPSGPRSAFRTEEDQESLKAEEPDLAATVGYSKHQAGLAIDLETGTGTNDAYRWLVQNAANFGFYSTVAKEPWHWEYIYGT